MDRSIRRLGGFLMLLFCALFAQLNYIQVFRADKLNERPENPLPVEHTFNQPRGTIATADGVVLARSVPIDNPDSKIKQARQFPEGELYGHLTGYFNRSFGATGLEYAYNEELAGETARQKLRSVGDLFSSKDRTGNLSLTVRSDVQKVARDALGDQRGTVVALDPRTGGVLAMWSNPGFDPNLLSSQDLKATEDMKKLLEADARKPLLAKAYREVYPPGSTFKVITGAAGVESGSVTPEAPVYPTLNRLSFPGISYTLPNFGGSSCGGALFTILAKSCNTSFGQMGIDLGAEALRNGAQAFGFNEKPPFDLSAVASSFPEGDFERNDSGLAQAAIGQNDVRATPLQMALVAAGIANDGVIMEPRLVDEIRDGQGDLVRKLDNTVWRRAVSPQTAETMREAMRQVVAGGSATCLQIQGVDVGAKTGTAQFGSGSPLRSHAWVIAWAGVPGQPPSIAVAVIVEGQEGASEATGGRVAAPIAKAVIEQALQPMPEPPPPETPTTTEPTTTTTAGG